MFPGFNSFMPDELTLREREYEAHIAAIREKEARERAEAARREAAANYESQVLQADVEHKSLATVVSHLTSGDDPKQVAEFLNTAPDHAQDTFWSWNPFKFVALTSEDSVVDALVDAKKTREVEPIQSELERLEANLAFQEAIPEADRLNVRRIPYYQQAIPETRHRVEEATRNIEAEAKAAKIELSDSDRVALLDEAAELLNEHADATRQKKHDLLVERDARLTQAELRERYELDTAWDDYAFAVAREQKAEIIGFEVGVNSTDGAFGRINYERRDGALRYRGSHTYHPGEEDTQRMLAINHTASEAKTARVNEMPAPEPSHFPSFLRFFENSANVDSNADKPVSYRPPSPVYENRYFDYGDDDYAPLFPFPERPVEGVEAFEASMKAPRDASLSNDSFARRFMPRKDDGVVDELTRAVVRGVIRFGEDTLHLVTHPKELYESTKAKYRFMADACTQVYSLYTGVDHPESRERIHETLMNVGLAAYNFWGMDFIDKAETISSFATPTLMFGGGALVARGVTQRAALSRSTMPIKHNFINEGSLERHFNKHSNDFPTPFNSPAEYLRSANFVIEHGHKVRHYHTGSGKWTTAYVRFMSNNYRPSIRETISNATRGTLGLSKDYKFGDARFEYVAVTSDGRIITYHTKNADNFFKDMNAKPDMPKSKSRYVDVSELRCTIM